VIGDSLLAMVHKSSIIFICDDRGIDNKMSSTLSGSELMQKTVVAAVILFWCLSALCCADTPGVVIDKKPETVERRSFDPKKPPTDMPPPEGGEAAECDSNFLVDANAACQARQTDATHAIMTITKITMTLQLDVVIWDPIAAPQYIVDHEECHRQISEYYYKNFCSGLAEKLAARYVGQQIAITGPDFQAAMRKELDRVTTAITDDYNKQLPVETTQERYDAINDHSRNTKITAKDSMDQALRETYPTTKPATQP
jgi:hypothetical protein